MKIRNGFVSNSSTSSFIFMGISFYANFYEQSDEKLQTLIPFIQEYQDELEKILDAQEYDIESIVCDLYHMIFDKEFGSLVSEVETVFPKSSSIPPYWYTEDFRLSKLNNQYDDNYQDYRDTPDYMRDTWDAMTDGMYGDMPDGFDGDFDFLGQ